MKPNLNELVGGFNIERYSDCTVLSHVYYWNFTNRCLIRAYCFQSRSIVIVSQLNGEISGDEILIAGIFQKLKLNRKNLIWINHQGAFSDCRLATEKFFQITFSWSIDSCEILGEIEISLQTLEDLIEFKLEPVESWFGLAPDLQQQRELQKQKETKNLMRLYLQPYLELFARELEYKQKSSQAERGALFYYPEAGLENNQIALIFMSQEKLEMRYDHFDVLALPYVKKYNPTTEMVVCVRTNDDYNICDIFPKPVPSAGAA